MGYIMSSQKCSAVIDGREIILETGHWAKQANSSVLVRCGDDVVLAAVTSAAEPSNQDFFPLTVEYQERFYSSGRIPGGFFKREGRPSHEAILSARVIDRFIRPCFPDNYRFETQVAASVLSFSGEYPVDVLSGLGAAAALHISDIPFSGPAASIDISRVGGEFVFNASRRQKEKSDMNLILAGTKKGILMVEGEADFVKEQDVLSALKAGHKALQPFLDLQEELKAKAGQEKKQWTGTDIPKTVVDELEKTFKDSLKKALQVPDKKGRTLALRKLNQDIKDHYNFEDEDKLKELACAFDHLKYKLARGFILQDKVRLDGRKVDEVRSIECQIDVLPCAWVGSFYKRGNPSIGGCDFRYRG